MGLPVVQPAAKNGMLLIRPVRPFGTTRGRPNGRPLLRNGFLL